jgi:hypothetical protein
MKAAILINKIINLPYGILALADGGKFYMTRGASGEKSAEKNLNNFAVHLQLAA